MGRDGRGSRLTKRACKNWLTDFRKWTYPRSEAPETFLFWSGLSTLASVVRRKVLIPKKLLGSWECSPFMYIFFISPPGQGRKTTTISYNDELLNEVPGINLAAQAMTQQDLMNRLSSLKEASITIHAMEFGTFYKPSQDVMIDFLTALFDGRRKFDSSTIIRGIEFASKPCVNLLAATTPKWIADNLTESMIGGGFMSRVIPIYEEHVRRRQMFYGSLDQEALDKIKQRLVADLQHLSSIAESEFTFAEDAKSFFEEWYTATADKYMKEDYRLHGYYERKPAHAMKIAMLLHLAYSDELILTLEDMKSALALLTQVERQMIRVFQSVGKNPYTVDMDQIREFIEEKGKVSRRELLNRFYHAAPPEMLMQLIQALIIMEKIKVNGNDPKEVYYLPVKPIIITPSTSSTEV